MIFTKLAVVLLATGIASAQEAIKVAPAEISETRTSTLIKKENFFSSNRDGLSIKLHVQGASLKGATRYGKIKVTDATDDLGNKLKLQESMFGGADDFREIDRFMDRDKAPTDSFDMSLDLSLPPRNATSIKTLKGEFQVLAGGDEKTVTLKNLPTLVDKPIKDPTLKTVGLKVRVTKAEAGAKTITIEYSGNISGMKNAEVLDASGEKASNGSMGSTEPDKQEMTYDLKEPLTKDIQVKLHFVVGQKTVKVPFDIHDLKLP